MNAQLKMFFPPDSSHGGEGFDHEQRKGNPPKNQP